METSIKIQGFDRAIQGLKVLPDKFQRNSILPILRASTRPLIKKAKSKLLGHGGAYGKLANSIGNITAKSKNAIIYVGPRTKGKFKYVGYMAHWVEYGTKGVKTSKSGQARKPKDEPYAKIVAMIPSGKRYRQDQPAKPFMRPAIDSEMANLKNTVAQNFEKYLDKQIKRHVAKL